MARLGENFVTLAIVLSTGRTGTMGLSRILSQGFRGVCALHEPRPNRHLRMAANAFRAGRISQKTLHRVLSVSRRSLLRRTVASTYVESNPYLSSALTGLDQTFAAPRIVHITRDPRTYVQSALNFGVQRGLKRILSDWMPYWSLKPEHLDAGSPVRWSEMNAVERFAWFWTATNEHLSHGEALYGERYLRVRFEDLFAADGRGIRRLATWLELTEIPGQVDRLLADKVNAAQGSEMRAWDHCTEEDRRTVLAHCRELMTRFGYALSE